MRRRTISSVITGTSVLVAVVAISAVAGVGTTSSGLITSADIKDGTVRTADLADGSVGVGKTKEALDRRLSGSRNATVESVSLSSYGAPGGRSFYLPHGGGLVVDTVPGELVVGRVELTMATDTSITEPAARAKCTAHLTGTASQAQDTKTVALDRGSMQASFVVAAVATTSPAALELECSSASTTTSSPIGSATFVLESVPRTRNATALLTSNIK